MKVTNYETLQRVRTQVLPEGPVWAVWAHTGTIMAY